MERVQELQTHLREGLRPPTSSWNMTWQAQREEAPEGSAPWPRKPPRRCRRSSNAGDPSERTGDPAGHAAPEGSRRTRRSERGTRQRGGGSTQGGRSSGSSTGALTPAEAAGESGEDSSRACHRDAEVGTGPRHTTPDRGGALNAGTGSTTIGQQSRPGFGFRSSGRCEDTRGKASACPSPPPPKSSPPQRLGGDQRSLSEEPPGGLERAIIVRSSGRSCDSCAQSPRADGC